MLWVLVVVKIQMMTIWIEPTMKKFPSNLNKNLKKKKCSIIQKVVYSKSIKKNNDER